jgi:hypothetical protein
MVEKQCNACGNKKPLEEFKPDQRSRDGCQGQCRECANTREREAFAAGKRSYAAARKQWWAQNGERHNKRRRTAHMQKLGVSIDKYDEVFEQQDGNCAICRQPETAMLKGKLKRLAVDHDHVTGVVRGLLCARCNRALGGFRDDAQLLQRAISYLEQVDVDTCKPTG